LLAKYNASEINMFNIMFNHILRLDFAVSPTCFHQWVYCLHSAHFNTISVHFSMYLIITAFLTILQNDNVLTARELFTSADIIQSAMYSKFPIITPVNLMLFWHNKPILDTSIAVNLYHWFAIDLICFTQGGFQPMSPFTPPIGAYLPSPR
jgi:hypothetical protein